MALHHSIKVERDVIEGKLGVESLTTFIISPQKRESIFLAKGMQGCWFSSPLVSHEARNVKQPMGSRARCLVVGNPAYLTRFLALHLHELREVIKDEDKTVKKKKKGDCKM